MKKFELTAETKLFCGRTLHRIRAVISFGKIKAGEFGGWIEKEENLDQSGDAWVSDEACVSGNAWVSGDACVSGNAWVSGDARVYGNAWVSDEACVSGNARVYGNAWVSGDACVSGNAWVSGDARVYGNAWVYGNASIFWIVSVGSRNGTVTFFACKDKKIRVACGCFFGDLEEFAEKVKNRHGDSKHGKVYGLAIEMAKERIDLSGVPESDEEEG